MSRLLSALAVLIVAGPAGAAPTQIRLSYMGQASSSVGVAWTTVSGTAGDTVEYGTTAGSYTSNATGKVTAIAGYGSVSEVTLVGLAAGTRYYYRVGSAAAGWSAAQAFSTGPAEHPECGDVRFVAIGDSRAESWEGDKGVSITWGQLLLLAMQKQPALVLHTGDIVYDGTNLKQWSNHLAATAPFSSQIPVLYALGNHDDGPGEGETANFNRLLHQPRSVAALGGSGTEDYYFFTYANAIFIALSTTSFKGSNFAEQAAWLDKVLTQNPGRWRFVYLHHPIYTEYLFINHPPDEVGQNAALVPVFNKHHVDLVFQGHNHFYERWVPSNCSSGGSKSPCPVASYDQGTTCITTGGGGAFPIFIPGGVNKVRLAASGAHHYMMLEVKNHVLTLETVDGTGKSIDTLTITKQVASPDPCLAPAPDAGADAGPDAAAPIDGSQVDASGVSDARVVDVSTDAPRTEPGTPMDQGSGTGTDGCSCSIALDRHHRGIAAPLALLLLAVAGVRRRTRR